MAGVVRYRYSPALAGLCLVQTVLSLKVLSKCCLDLEMRRVAIISRHVVLVSNDNIQVVATDSDTPVQSPTMYGGSSSSGTIWTGTQIR